MDKADKIKELELLYKEFEEKFTLLKQEQDKIVTDFLENIRQKRIEHLKSSIINN